MLKNYITDTDLQKYFPKINSYLWSGSSDYSVLISEAFNQVVDDLISRELDYVRLGTPIDLLRTLTSSDNQNKLTIESFSANDFQTHLKGERGFRRLVLEIYTLSTGASTCKIVLQGSNEIGISDSTEPTNWDDITTITPTATGVSSVIIQEEFDYYRLGIYNTANSYTTTDGVTTFTEATAFTGVVRLTATLVETYIDRWITWKTFEMIFRDFSKESNDIWDKRAEECGRLYKQSVDSFKFVYDTNNNNLVNASDILNQDGQSRLSR